jgi:hypothetical protein
MANCSNETYTCTFVMTHIHLRLGIVPKIMQSSSQTNTHPPTQETTRTVFTKPASRYYSEPDESIDIVTPYFFKIYFHISLLLYYGSQLLSSLDILKPKFVYFFFQCIDCTSRTKQPKQKKCNLKSKEYNLQFYPQERL